MIGSNQIAGAQLLPARSDALAAARAKQLTHQSSMRENVFEHILLGQLGSELIARGVEYDEFHSSVDREGFDIVLEAGGILRHIQLKVTIDGGARSEVTISTRLAARPSGCVIWLTYDPVERHFCDIRWYGDAPGRSLPDLGDRVARHSRANSCGVKADRPGHRVVPTRRFERLDDIGHLADRLFGRLPADPLAFIRSRLRRDPDGTSDWLDAVADGDLTAIPADIAWNDATRLAHLVDGYRLLEVFCDEKPDEFLDRQREAQHATGSWPGDVATLWTTLFLEARAARFGANDLASETPHLDLLSQQLREALIALEAADA